MKCNKCNAEFDGNFCSNCGAKVLFCPQCGMQSTGDFCHLCGEKMPKQNNPQSVKQISTTPYKRGISCPQCHSDNVIISPVTETQGSMETKNRGCLSWFIWIVLACFTFGLILIIPLVTNSKTKGSMNTRTYNKAVCQNCGNGWVVR